MFLIAYVYLRCSKDKIHTFYKADFDNIVLVLMLIIDLSCFEFIFHGKFSLG